MPRRKLARRFEPRWGVSQQMLEVEAGYVAREVEDYLLLSLNDLRDRFAERTKDLAPAHAALNDRLSLLPERERLALRCVMIRDAHHLIELYLTYLRAAFPPPAAPRAGRAEPREGETAAPAGFTEWLFGGEAAATAKG